MGVGLEEDMEEFLERFRLLFWSQNGMVSLNN